MTQAVQMHPAAMALEPWLAARPRPGADFYADSTLLAAHIGQGEQHLAALPPVLARTAPQRQVAAAIHRSCRRLRSDFVKAHAGAIHDAAAGCRSGHVALAEIAYSAAQLIPGLVPTRAQIGAERDCEQAAKEGREIDQGIFFGELLRHPQVGARIVAAALQPSARAQALLAQFRADGQIDLGKVHVARRGVAAHVTVNNPACLNAEDDALIDAMETAIDLVLLDDACHVGILRGGAMTHPRYAGKRVFSAGINLKELHQGKISFVDFLLRRELGYINKMARGLSLAADGERWRARRCEKPWIAAVDGFAIGGGAQLLLVCDHVIACADSFFSLPAAQEGIIPGAANLRLARRAGARMARQIILDGRKVHAHEPDAELLFDSVVASADMEAAIDERVRRLDSPAVIVNRRMLKLSEEPLDLFRAYMAEFSVEQALRLYSDDVLRNVRGAAPAVREPA